MHYDLMSSRYTLFSLSHRLRVNKVTAKQQQQSDLILLKKDFFFHLITARQDRLLLEEKVKHSMRCSGKLCGREYYSWNSIDDEAIYILGAI